MDFLDPKKRHQHIVMLYVGYGLISVAIIATAVVLLYQSYGFGINRKGDVIQNGLVFLSSQPSAADITINGKLAGAKTNTRLVTPAATYKVGLNRPGYDSWNRVIILEPSSVARFDYPLLVPSQLTTTALQTYFGPPTMASPSPDRRWLAIGQPGDMNSFNMFDLNNPTKEAALLRLPDGLLTKAATTESWLPLEWSDDNSHLLLKHIYDDKFEYILLNRTNIAESVNLSRSLGSSPDELTLRDKKYDKYYMYNATTKLLSTATLQHATPQTVLEHVLRYKTYGNDIILYVTDANAIPSRVNVRILDGDKSYGIRTLQADTNYLLDITQYDGTFFAAIGATNDNRVSIYKDPEAQVTSGQRLAVPTNVLKLNAPNYISFSSNAQFIMAENAQQFSLYDVFNKKSYNYTSASPLDAPQSHAIWMDGDRLTYTSGGTMHMFDYDYTNRHVLMPAISTYTPYFAPDYRTIYTMYPNKYGAGFQLEKTSLLIPSDQ
jgi:hypothetical protein